MADLPIPEEAVKKAVHTWYGTEPDEVDPADEKECADGMRAVLAAVAPLIEATAWEAAANHVHGMVQAWGYGPDDDPPPKSQAAAVCNVVSELRDRAAELRTGQWQEVSREVGRRLLTEEAEAAAADVAVPMPEHEGDCPKCLRPMAEHTIADCPPPL